MAEVVANTSFTWAGLQVRVGDVFDDSHDVYQRFPSRFTASVSGPTTTVATDPIWDAADDLAVGTGPDTAARLPVAASRIIAKLAAGGLKACTVAEINTLLGAVGLSNATPQPDGAAAAGTGTSASRDDHVHALSSGALTRIAQIVVSSAQATLDFTSIAATYESLVLDLMGRGTAAATEVDLLLRMNGDTGANYDWMFGYFATSVGDAPAVTDTKGRIGSLTAGSATAGKPTIARLLLPGYARTVFQKVAKSELAEFKSEATSGLSLIIASVLWRNTAAVNQLTLLLSSGNFDVGTVATLYGVT